MIMINRVLIRTESGTRSQERRFQHRNKDILEELIN